MLRQTQKSATILDLIDIGASLHPGKTAFIFLDTEGGEAGRLNYYSLQQMSRAFAANLQQRPEASGSVILIALPTGANLITAFFGSLCAGVQPVLLPPPRHKKDRQNLERLQGAVSDTQAGRVYVAEGDAAAVKTLGLSPRCEVVIAGQWEPTPAEHWKRPVISGESPAYVQFTSGSTARPRGIVLSHENVLSNLELIHRVFKHDDDLIGLGWLPLHHDMGLVGHVLEPLFAGGTSVLAPPSAVIRNPLNWLKAISLYRATDSGGPPFAYDFCTQRARTNAANLDLSCWRNAYVGAEPVSDEILKAFASAFAPHGFQPQAFLPCYGLAEATLLVAGGRSIASRKLSSVNNGGRKLTGYPCVMGGPDIRIVSPVTGHEQREGEHGEIWVSGTSVAQAYFRNTDATRDTFVPANFVEHGRTYLRTGDLGFIENRELYITGRLKDVIIIRGVNYYPEDLEATVRASHQLPGHGGAVVCFSIPGRVTEELIVVQEVKPAMAGSWPEVFAAVQESMVLEHGLQVTDMILVRRGALPRTSSGKLSRAASREAYLHDRLMGKAIWCSSSANGKTETGAQVIAPRDSSHSSEPIAVIGFSCRFPGAETGTDAFWSVLVEGLDAICEIPPERWEADSFYDPRPAIPGKMNTRWGGFLNGIERFDAEFFGIAPHEAAEIDPQHRLLLETAWRAFEHAGVTQERLSGSETGVFVGISTNDYLHLQIKLKPGLELYNAYSGLGNADSISVNRLSYIFNLRGPSIAVDTACSSSMTALHLAAQSLRNGECSMALAGGVNAILSPSTTITLSQFNMMAPDGRCKVFDSKADGYVRSEGCGVVLLKRKSDALRDGDNILAYLSGSALGQNGRGPGITAPSAESQRHLIEKALADAHRLPEEITFIEAHGTGTSIGDPVEVEQLKNIYGVDSAAGTCYLGSVKASVGHLEAAAGIASVIKLILSFQHREIPPQIHLQQLNPRISLDNSRLVIPRERTRWEPAAGRRVAAVSSFGFGGANAHAIFEAAEAAVEMSPVETGGRGAFPFPLSGKSEAALREHVKAWIQYLDRPSRASLASLSYSQAVRRSHFGYRANFVAASQIELRDRLSDFLQAERADGAEATRPCGGIAFLFSGQGAQYPAMGRELYAKFEIFRRSFDRCAQVFAEESDQTRSLQSIIFSEDKEALASTLYLQPALFALEYALAQLWISLGVQPTVLLGHSLGEYAAACIAGCFDVEAGLLLVMRRARLMASIPVQGAMAALSISESGLRAFIEAEGLGLLSVAAVNAPGNIVISGLQKDLNAALAACERQGIAARTLRASHAFHSAVMDEILDEFEKAASEVSFRKPLIPLISNLTGEEMEVAPDAAYWRRHLRGCVRFQSGVDVLVRKDTGVCLEIGAGEVLLNLFNRCAPRSPALLLPSLRNGEDEAATFLEATGRLYTQGANLRWPELYERDEVRYVPDLPGQPFYRKRYWFMAEESVRELRGLAAAEQGRSANSTDARCVYDLRWVKSELPATASLKFETGEQHHWIIVGDGKGLASELVKQLRQQNHQVFRISYESSARRGRSFHRTTDRPSGAQQFFVPDGCTVETYREVIKDILGRYNHAGEFRWNVLYLHGLDCVSPEATSVESLERDQRLHGVGDLAALAQTSILFSPTIRLWVVTAQAQPVHQAGQPNCVEPVNLAQSPIWGFAHTLFLERPEMRGGLIDLANGDKHDARQAEQVLAQIMTGDAEPQAAFRSDGRYVPRLLRAEPLEAATNISFRQDGVYLITGGLGGLGLKCARWLAERGAGHIILLGRRTLPPREMWDALPAESEDRFKVESIRVIEETGAKVETVAVDVADYRRMTEIVNHVEADGRRLRGVLHAAGVNWFGKIAELDREELLESLKIKVSAAWHLHQLTRERELDIFLLFSSVSALWGSVDLAHYSAANQFLDSLAYHRRREGQPGLSINWGPWSTVGMSARANEIQLLTKLGFHLMSPEQAIGIMESLLLADATRAVVTDIDWRQFQSFVNFSTNPLFFEKLSVETSAAKSPDGVAGVETEWIKTAPRGEALARLRLLVRQHLSAVLLLEPGREVDVSQRFNLMGMDSLMAIAFALRLENIAGMRLPTALAYNYPTIQDVAEHLFELIRGEKPLESMTTGAEPTSLKVSPPPTRRQLWFPSLNGHDAAAPLRLFCFPYAGAGVSVYQPWLESLLPLAEVVPVQLPGREARSGEPLISEMRELASALAGAVEELRPAPFAFFGHSMGAMVCFETARELRRRGADLPQLLILSACVAPNAQRETQLHELSDDEFKKELVKNFEMPVEAVADEMIWQALLPSLRSDIRLLELYEPSDEPPLEVPICVFGGAHDPVASREHLLAWSAFTSVDFSLRLFSGSHMFVRSQGEEVQKAIRRELSSSTVCDRAGAAVRAVVPAAPVTGGE